jgi:hypothetical protein
MRVDEVSENNNDKNGSESSVKSTLTFSFRSRCEDGDKRIDEFITVRAQYGQSCYVSCPYLCRATGR